LKNPTTGKLPQHIRQICNCFQKNAKTAKTLNHDAGRDETLINGQDTREAVRAGGKIYSKQIKFKKNEKC